MNASDAIDRLQSAADALRTSPHRAASAIRLPARGRLLATGDLHDNPAHLDRILRLARLQENGDHHVAVHELIHGDRLVNGIDFSHRMLVRVAELVVAFPQQVHPLLANHELSQLTGRGVSKGAGNSVELFDQGLEYAFSDEWEDVREAVNDFIGAMPLALLSEDGVCCAHSLPDARKMDRFDPRILDRDLNPDDLLRPDGNAYLMTWGRAHTDEQVEALADAWQVELFILGHQHVETGIEVTGRRTVVLNSDHDRATALPIDLTNVPGAGEALLHAVPLSSVAV